MNAPEITNRQLLQLASTYWQWRWTWVSTTAAFAVLGLFYVLFLKGDTWVASQGLIVRDEATGAVMRLGRFQSQTEMKAAQETVLEMARNAQVLRGALATVGRERGWFTWLSGERPPTSAEVEELAKNGIEVRAPRGAELGTTEVIYLDVKQPSRARALELNKAVCEQLEKRLQQVRKARADGVIAELTTARAVAQLNLEKATERLQAMEAEAGADLSDLRGLTDNNIGGSTNRQILDSIKTELRQAELQHQQVATDLNLAAEAFENPEQLLLTPGKLVNSQPGLKKLREGLADARIVSSQLKGRFTPSHQLVVAAEQTEARIREQLREELGLSVRSLTKDEEIAANRVKRLKRQQTQLEARLETLARIRADYGNTVSEVRARNAELQDTERELAQAQASRDAAITSSLVTRLDAPIIGESPIGPGRSTILAGATLSGLFFGLGVVFLLTPLDGAGNYGRRRNDYSGGTGRRISDQSPSSAQASAAASAEPAPASGAGMELQQAIKRSILNGGQTITSAIRRWQHGEDSDLSAAAPPSQSATEKSATRDQAQPAATSADKASPPSASAPTHKTTSGGQSSPSAGDEPGTPKQKATWSQPDDGGSREAAQSAIAAALQGSAPFSEQASTAPTPKTS